MIPVFVRQWIAACARTGLGETSGRYINPTSLTAQTVPLHSRAKDLVTSRVVVVEMLVSPTMALLPLRKITPGTTDTQ